MEKEKENQEPFKSYIDETMSTESSPDEVEEEKDLSELVENLSNLCIAEDKKPIVEQPAEGTEADVSRFGAEGQAMDDLPSPSDFNPARDLHSQQMSTPEDRINISPSAYQTARLTRAALLTFTETPDAKRLDVRRPVQNPRRDDPRYNLVDFREANERKKEDLPSKKVAPKKYSFKPPHLELVPRAKKRPARQSTYHYRI